MQVKMEYKDTLTNITKSSIEYMLNSAFDYETCQKIVEVCNRIWDAQDRWKNDSSINENDKFSISDEQIKLPRVDESGAKYIYKPYLFIAFKDLFV